MVGLFTSSFRTPSSATGFLDGDGRPISGCACATADRRMSHFDRPVGDGPEGVAVAGVVGSEPAAAGVFHGLKDRLSSGVG
jgi:hypothetical protein